MTQELKQQKTVLVTGASRGIGKAVAARFARAGYAVAVHYHTGKAEAETFVQQLVSEGCTAVAVQADIRDSAQVQTMIDTVVTAFGNIDILINNAGIAQQKLFTDITEDEWKNMFAVHVDGTFFCTRAVLPAMIQQKQGVIVNISSMWGQIGGSCEVHYSAAKGAVQAMTMALAKEVGPSKIRVNCIAPGVIQTEMNKLLDADTLEALRQETPLEVLGTVEDIANMAYFLCTEEAAFITGQIIGVNGGMVIENGHLSACERFCIQLNFKN